MVGKLQWMEGDMVGNFPQGARKSVPSHRTFSLVHPSYRREFPILFSISVEKEDQQETTEIDK
jgi:hypothetical protein